MMKVVLLVVALFAVYCSAQLTSADISKILSLHNTARANVSPAPQTPLPALVWDTTVAADAQSWVSQCKLNYSPKFYATTYGENPITMTPSLDVQTAFNSWISQQSSYNFADGSCSASTCMNFQQIVASKTTAVGCAVATCSFGAFFVCNYKSFAQYTGVVPYTPVAGSATQKPTIKPTSPPVTLTSTHSATATTTGTPSSTTSSSGYASIDYRGTKAVLGVHDQKQCGSCWAFSTTAIIEGALGLKGFTVPMLSDQNTLDCSGGGTCDGGWTGTALRGMITQAGINTQAAYPYAQAKGTCSYNAAASQGKILKYGQTAGDFASIYNALVSYGPVGIAVFADDSWNSYRSGVISVDYTSVNHAVTVVGYDSTLDAWIVKNSWGPSWGMSGFLYLSAKHPAGANQNGAFWATA